MSPLDLLCCESVGDVLKANLELLDALVGLCLLRFEVSLYLTRKRVLLRSYYV